MVAQDWMGRGNSMVVDHEIKGSIPASDHLRQGENCGKKILQDCTVRGNSEVVEH